MCTVSMINDHFSDKWNGFKTYTTDSTRIDSVSTPLTDEEIRLLRELVLRDMPEFKALLERARQYDIDNGEPDCELEEKKQRVLELADELGIEIDFL